MQSGPISRSRKSEKAYIQHKKNRPDGGCDFCEIVENGGSQVSKTSRHSMIIYNIFGYDVWDGCGVIEHLIIIPKRHVVSLKDLSTEEQADYFDLMADYESKGYSLYARSPGNLTKSVAHQHTHLIKVDNNRKNLIFYMRKPHVLMAK